MSKRTLKKVVNKIGGLSVIGGALSVGVVGGLVIAVYIIAGILAAVTGIGTFINLAWFGAFEGFLFAEVFLAQWYATFAYYLFIAGLILGAVMSLLRSPLSIILVIPFLLAIFFAVSGGIEIISQTISTDGLGEFGKPTLEGIMYSSVGASAAKSVNDDDDD